MLSPRPVPPKRRVDVGGWRERPYEAERRPRCSRSHCARRSTRARRIHGHENDAPAACPGKSRMRPKRKERLAGPDHETAEKPAQAPSSSRRNRTNRRRWPCPSSIRRLQRRVRRLHSGRWPPRLRRAVSKACMKDDRGRSRDQPPGRSGDAVLARSIAVSSTSPFTRNNPVDISIPERWRLEPSRRSFRRSWVQPSTRSSSSPFRSTMSQVGWPGIGRSVATDRFEAE